MLCEPGGFCGKGLEETVLCICSEASAVSDSLFPRQKSVNYQRSTRRRNDLPTKSFCFFPASCFSALCRSDTVKHDSMA